MEILMKLKCSPSASPHGNNTPTLKVVDHHRQLTQQHAALQPPPQMTAPAATATPSSLTRLPTQTNLNYNSPSVMPPMALHSRSPRLPTAARPCMNYTTNKPSLECCNISANQQEAELYDLQWRERQGRTGVGYEVAMQRPPSCCANMPAGGNMYETPACCSGSCQLPGCGVPPSLPPPLPPIATQHMSATPPIQPPPLQQAPPVNSSLPPPPPPLAYPMTAMTPAADACFDHAAAADLNTHYEYQEPEENFISIEDTKIKNLLIKIGEECELQKKEKASAAAAAAAAAERKKREQQVVYEIIDLDDEDDREELRQIRSQAENSTQKLATPQNILQHGDLSIVEAPAAGLEKPKQTRMKSPSISLIPKSPPSKTPAIEPTAQEEQQKRPSKERIIAHIDLSDSSDSEGEHSQKLNENIGNREREIQHVSVESENDNDIIDDDNDDDVDELTYAAAAVSCELECEDDDYHDNDYVVNTNLMAARSAANFMSDEVVILNSDDENVECMDKRKGVAESHWEDFDRREKGRQYFECSLCGKTVQSSYNLRRHMMIHTGERPFGCDMCVRRFREFSDLKKHRRRHGNEPNFLCMVCRMKPPMEHDPTRCNNCESKTIATVAAAAAAASATRLDFNTPPTTLSASSPDKSQTPPTTITTTTTTIIPAIPATVTQRAPPQLTAKPVHLANAQVRENTRITTTATATRANNESPIYTSTPTNNSIYKNNSKSSSIIGATFAQQTIAKAGASPKRPNSNTTIMQQNTDIPSLVPINTPITQTKTVSTNAQLLLENIPAVHRSNYNEFVGVVVTRKEYPCPLCQRAFGTRHNLKRHYMIHTGEKPFSCNKCRKPFREYSTLKKHMVTHQRERYYKCLHCPRKFRDYLEYNEHKKMHAQDGDGDGDNNNDIDDDNSYDMDDDEFDNVNFDQQNFSSSTSCASSPNKRARTTTQYDVSSEDDSSAAEDCWLECCECKQRFTDIDTYTKHLKEHDPTVYLYECYICKKTFEQRDDLVEHVGACKVELRETALQRAKCFN